MKRCSSSHGTRPIRIGRLRNPSLTSHSPMFSRSMLRPWPSSSAPRADMANTNRQSTCANACWKRLTPLPVWWEPLEEQQVSHEDYPLHALTQRPAAMYHSWGSQNAWLRQIHGHNPLYIPTAVWKAQGFAEGDWARVTSPHGEITVPVARSGRAQSQHGLDVERHWQAQGRVGARPRGSRSQERLFA